MNFTEVLNANGQLITMLATVLEVGASKLNINQKPYQSAKLRDDAGEEHNVTINKGNGILLTSDCLNQRLQFAIQTYQGQRGAAFSGYWNNTAQVSQQSYPSLPSGPAGPEPPRAAPVAPQRTIAPPPTRNSRDESIERQNALRHADVALQSNNLNTQGYQDWAEMCLCWIQTGQWESQKEREAAQDLTNPDIPF